MNKKAIVESLEEYLARGGVVTKHETPQYYKKNFGRGLCNQYGGYKATGKYKDKTAKVKRPHNRK